MSGHIFKPSEHYGEALAPRRDNRYFNVRTETGRWRNVFDLEEFPIEAGAYGDNEILRSWVEQLGSGCDLHGSREIEAAIAGWSNLKRGEPYDSRQLRRLRREMTSGPSGFIYTDDYGITHSCQSSLWDCLDNLDWRAPGGGRHLKA